MDVSRVLQLTSLSVAAAAQLVSCDDLPAAADKFGKLGWAFSGEFGKFVPS